MRLRIRHTKRGKIRFTSHRDTARHWERAVRKVNAPLAYSAGFTPRPRMSFGLALPTGAESDAEYMDIELAEGANPDLGYWLEVFRGALPPGYEVTHVALRDAGSPSLQEDVVATTWLITLEGVSADELEEAVRTTLAAPTIELSRERKGTASVDDVRPAILDLSPAPAGDDDPRPRLCATLATTGRGLRPLELVQVVFPALDAVDTAARLLRTHQWIERDGERREIIPAGADAARLPVGCA